MLEINFDRLQTVKECEKELPNDSSDNQDRDRKNDKNECEKEGGRSDKHGK